MGKVNNKDGLMVECWLDDEPLSKKAFLFLRKLAIKYQTKDEILCYLNEYGLNSYLNDYGRNSQPGISNKKIQEIKTWAAGLAIDEARRKEENRRLLMEQKEREKQEREAAEANRKSKKFEGFMSCLESLCRAMEVGISAGYDNEIIISDLEEGEYPFPPGTFEDKITA